MRRYGVLLGLALLFIVLQVTLLSKLHLGWARPDFAFLIVVYLGLNRPFGENIPAVLAIGYVTDVFSGLPDGTFIMLYVICLCAVNILTRILYFRGNIFPVLVVSGLSLLYVAVLSGLWALAFGKPVASSGLTFWSLCSFAAVNTVGAIVVFRMCRKLDAWLIGAAPNTSTRVNRVLLGR